MGLTINYDLEQVFWIVQGNKGTLLYKANIDSPETSQLVSHVGPPVAKGHFLPNILHQINSNINVCDTF